MAQFDVLQQQPALDNSADVVQKKDDKKIQRRRSRSGEPIQLALVGQLQAESSNSVESQLAQLYADSPQLYAEAMSGLQQHKGNQEISQLHSNVMQLAKAPPVQASQAPAGTAIQAENAVGGDIVEDDELSLKLGGTEIKFTKDSGEFTHKFEKGEWKFPKKPFKKEKLFPVPICPGLSGYIGFGVEAGAEVVGQITVKASKPGDAWTVDASAAIAGEGKGLVKFMAGGMGGIPYIANLRLQGVGEAALDIKPKVELKSSLTVGGGKDVQGRLSLEGKVEAQATIEVYVEALYQCLDFWSGKLDGEPTQFAKYSFGKWVIGTAYMDMEGGYDTTIGDTFFVAREPTVVWGEAAPKHELEAGKAVDEASKEREQKRLHITTMMITYPSYARFWEMVGQGILTEEYVQAMMNTDQMRGRDIHRPPPAAVVDPLFPDRPPVVPIILDDPTMSTGPVTIQLTSGPLSSGSGSDSDTSVSMPAEVQSKMEEAFDHDFSDVEMYEGNQAPAVGARAYAQGNEVHFAPGEFKPETSAGQELIGHELAHVVQQDAGRVGGSTNTAAGMQINSDAGLESEADRAGAAAASGQAATVGGGGSGIQRVTTREWSREEFDQLGTTSGEITYEADNGVNVAENVRDVANAVRGAPDNSAKVDWDEARTTCTISVAGQSVELTVEPDADLTIRKSMNFSPVNGLTLTSVSITVNDAGDIDTGSVSGRFESTYVNAPNVTFSVRQGGAINLEINGAELKVGDIVVGTADMVVGSDGISGVATVTANQITVGNGLTVNSGTVSCELKNDGSFSGNGALELGIADVGKVNLTAEFSNETLSGRATLTLDQPIEVVSGVHVESVTLTGDFTPEGFKLEGTVKVNVRNLARAEITGSYSYPENKFSGDGKLTQIPSVYNIGDVEIRETELTAKVTDNVLEEVGGKCKWKLGPASGELDGTFDVPNTSFSGSGTGKLDEAVKLSENGPTITQAEGTITIENNKPTTVVGSVTAQVPYENEPTFELSVTGVTVDLQTFNFTGTGRATLLRECSYTIGDTTVTLKSGTVEATVTENNFEKATMTDVQFAVTTKLGGKDVAFSGAISSGTYEDGKISATVELTLDQAISFGEGETTFDLKSGTFEVEVKENAFEVAKVKGIEVEYRTNAGDGQLALNGQISEGELRKDGKVDLKGEITLAEEFSVTDPKYTFKINQGGKVDFEVKDSAFESAELTNVSVEASATLGESTLKVRGDINKGKIDKDYKFDLDVDLTLVDPFTVSFGERGDATLAANGKLNVKFDKSEFTEATVTDLKLTVNLKIGSQTIVLEGDISSGKVDKDGKVDVTVGITVNGSPEVTFGDHSVKLHEGGNVEIEVKQSEFESCRIKSLGADASIKIGDHTLKLTGQVEDQGGEIKKDGKIDLNASLTITDRFEFSAGIVDGALEANGKLTVDIKDSALRSVDIEAALIGEAKIKLAGGPDIELKGTLTAGSFNPGLDTLKGELSLENSPKFDLPSDMGDITIGPGSLEFEFTGGSFQYVQVKNALQAAANIKIGNDLKLGGEITSGKVDKDGKVDIDASIKVTENCDIKFGEGEKHTATIKQDGELKLLVEQSDFKHVELKEVGVGVKIKVRDQDEGTLDISGKVDGKVAGADQVDLKGKITLDNPYTTKFGASDEHSVTLESGEFEVDVAASSFVSATLKNVEARAEIAVPGVATPLVLVGKLDGKVDKDGLQELTGSIKVGSNFVYEFGDGSPKHSITLKADGGIDFEVKAGKFEKAGLDLEIDAVFQVDGSPLNLNGKVTGGIDKDYKVDLNGKITVSSQFDYTFGDPGHRVSLKQGGFVEVDVKGSKFEYAKLDLEIEAVMKVDGKDLCLNGKVKGEIDKDYKVDFDGKITVAPSFEYEFGTKKHKVTLKEGGFVSVEVKKSVFEKAELDLEVDALVKLEEQELQLNGSVKGKIDKDYKVDLEGKLKVASPLTYTFGEKNHTVTLKQDGEIGIVMKASEFEEATLDLEVDAVIKVDNKDLCLNGKVKGKIDKDYKVDFDGKITVSSPFEYEFGEKKHKVTLKQGGEIGILIKTSNFEEATLDLEVDAVVKVDGKDLCLNGKVKGKIDKDYKVDIDGMIKVSSNFEYEFGAKKHKVTLKEGGSIGIVMKASEFEEATLDLDIDAIVKVDDKDLCLNGKVKGKIDKDFLVDVEGTIKVSSNFEYEFGDKKHKVTLKQNGQIGLVMKASEFEEATLDLDVDAIVKVDDKDLCLNGKVKGKIDKDYKVDIDGKIKVSSNFEYEFGEKKHKVTLKEGGEIGIVMKASEFEEATLDLEVDAIVKVDDKDLCLNGKVKGKIDKSYLVDIDGKIKVTSPFEYEFGEKKHKVTLKAGGEIGIVMKASQFEEATLDLEVDAIIKVDGQDLCLNGKVTGKIDKDYLVDIDGKITVSSPFEYEFGEKNHKVTLKQGGEIGIVMKKSEFEEANLDLEVDAIIKVDNQDLCLNGKVKGKITKDYLVDIDGTVTVSSPFEYEFGEKNHKVTLKSGGSIGIVMKASQFEEATLDLEVDAIIKVDGQDLCLNGKVKGKIDKDYNVDIDGKIEVTSPFIYEFGADKHKVTLKAGGKLGIVVKASAFEEANLDLEVEAILKLQGKELKLTGKVTGKIDKDYNVDIKGTIRVDSTFELEFGDHKARLMEGGELEVVVEQSAFKSAEFRGIVVQADIKVGSQWLYLEGRLETGKVDDKLKVDVLASIKVREDFVYTLGPVTATLKENSELKVSIEQSAFKYAELLNVEVLADITISGKTLKLKGTIHEGKYENDLLSFVGSIAVVEDFTVELGPVKATLCKDSELKVTITNSEFVKAELIGVKVLAEIDIRGKKLEIEGTVDEGVYDGTNITFQGTLKLLNTFEDEFANVKARFMKDASLTVRVENNAFKWAELANLVIEADIKIGEKTIYLGGTLTRGRYEDGKIDFLGTISVKQDFEVELGPVKARLLKDSGLTVSVEKNEFKYAELTSVKFEADIKITDTKTLYLAGDISEGRYDGETITFEGGLSLKEDFKVIDEEGKTVTFLKDASLRVRVEENVFKWAELTGLMVDVKFTIQGRLLHLKGGLESGRYEDGKVSALGSITLQAPFEYTMGSITARLNSGTLKVSVENSEFQWAEVTNVAAEVEFKLGGNDSQGREKVLKLGGEIVKGKYDKDGNFDLEGSISLLSPVELFHAGKFTATLESATVGFKIEQNELKEISASGRASLVVDAGAGNNISGYLEVSWRRVGTEDKFSGKGKLTVSMLEGKLTGEIDAELFENGNWTIKGELDYVMNEHIGGKIGVEMDQELDPVLSGEIRITNKELHPGLDLIALDTAIVPAIAVNFYGLNLGIGCDAEFLVKLLPVMFNATIGISDFRPLHMNMPRFDATAEISSGIQLVAAVKPYLAMFLGATGFEAGIKCQGKVALEATLGVTGTLGLHADGNKFWGELGFGISFEPELVLSFQPLAYAKLGSEQWDYGLTDPVEYRFSLFKFEWSKEYKFGDDGQTEQSGPAATPAAIPGSPVQEEEAPAEQEAPGRTPAPAPTTSPQTPGIGPETQTEEEGAEKSEMQQKMEDIQEWATHIGNVAKLIGFMVDVVTLSLLIAPFLGPAAPIAPLIAIVIAMVKNSMGPSDFVDAFVSLGWLLGKAMDWIASLLPDWFIEAWEEIKRLMSLGARGMAEEVSTKIKEACPQIIPAPWADVAQPLFDWAASMAYELIMAFEGFNPINPLDWIILLLKLMWAGISGAKALIEAFEEAGSRLVKLVQELVYSGDIVVHCTDVDDWGMNPWKVKCHLPGICDVSYGPSDDEWLWLVCQFANGILKNTFGVRPNTNTSTSDYGFDY